MLCLSFSTREAHGTMARPISFRTLYGKVCTYDPCPLVQGDVLVWRDGGHRDSDEGQPGQQRETPPTEVEREEYGVHARHRGC